MAMDDILTPAPEFAEAAQPADIDLEQREKTEQEVVDYLVQATEEQDVLYVVHRLRRMKDLGMLWTAAGNTSGIERTHSWRGCSALTAVATKQRTPLREFILKLFFFNLEDPLNSYSIDTDAGQWKDWAKKIRDKWEYRWRAASLDALGLLRLPGLEAVAIWIDDNLVLPPNPAGLTGYNYQRSTSPAFAMPFHPAYLAASPSSLSHSRTPQHEGGCSSSVALPTTSPPSTSASNSSPAFCRSWPRPPYPPSLPESASSHQHSRSQR
ncbi:hypothetical protein JCM11641_002188 [Rhodosporidiobolus odoratus]